MEIFQENIQEENERKVREARAFLVDTDFYYVRKVEIGEDVPRGIEIQRAYCRDFLRDRDIHFKGELNV
jgi:hypothetical protein